MPPDNYNGQTPIIRYPNVESMSIDAQVEYYKARAEKLSHVNKELRSNLRHERLAHSSTKKHMEVAIRNEVSLQRKLKEQLSAPKELLPTQYWWQKIINHFS